MNQATTNAEQRHEVTYCWVQCSKIKELDVRNACYETCVRTYLQSLFAAISKAAEEIDTPPSTFLDIVKKQFDAQYEAAKTGGTVGVAGAACCG